MGRRIVIMSNCQTGGLYAALGGMLPDDEHLPIAWLGTEPEGLRDLLSIADVFVSSLPRAESEALLAAAGSRARLIPVPVIWFPGFHPDIIHVPSPEGGELASAVGPYNSMITLWGWRNGWSAEAIIEAFTPATFAGLGYPAHWTGMVNNLRTVFETAEMDFASWFLPLARGSAFMLTDNHPRLDALVQMARLVALDLGADPALVRYRWEQAIADGLLATSVVWPIYPGIAEGLGLPGAYVWRAADGELMGLEPFVRRSLAAYEGIDPRSLTIARFDHDQRFAAVLGGS